MVIRENAYQIKKVARPGFGASLFCVVFFACISLSAVLIGRFPLQASIATIFLFAGLHNWLEFRYFVGRMPIRWGRSTPYYSTAIAGVVFLTALYWFGYFGSGNWIWSNQAWSLYASVWNTLLIVWLLVLYALRKRYAKQNHSWFLVLSIASLLASLTWLMPLYCSLALVFLHPLVAMWFLERQIRRTKKEWLGAYHLCMAAVPLFLIGLAIWLSRQPDLPEDEILFWKIAQHAGSQLFPGISSHLLVTIHVFLETIHYFVWLLLIPLVDPRSIPWRLREIPMFSHSRGFPKIAIGLLAMGALAGIALWVGFSIDYAWTRDIYFAVAILHVLAEFPFLIKML